MSKVLVRKCPFTGHLFEDDRMYAEHLCKLRTKQKDNRSVKAIRRQRYDVFSSMRDTCNSAADIEHFIMDNWKYFVYRPDNPLSEQPKRTPNLLDISIKLNWEWSVSNTHAAPLTGPFKGVTNWHGNRDLPTGYPGWSGNISFALD